MQQINQMLYDTILRLPLEKVGKAIPYVRYLEREPEDILLLDPSEEKELRNLHSSGDFLTSDEVLSRIDALPND